MLAVGEETVERVGVPARAVGVGLRLAEALVAVIGEGPGELLFVRLAIPLLLERKDNLLGGVIVVRRVAVAAPALGGFVGCAVGEARIRVNPISQDQVGVPLAHHVGFDLLPARAKRVGERGAGDDERPVSGLVPLA